MGTEVDVFISNYTLVDPEIYQLWVDGHTASEAVSILNQRGLGKTTGASVELIASDVLDHYRTYSLVEKVLNNPNKLQEQLAFQIDPQTRQLLIDKYYELDDEVVRELIGKKLTSKHRKDLDEVAEKTGIPLKSCRRQFDNVKRVYKTVEDMPGSVLQNIQNCFYLPENVAQKYACIVFLASVRFETSKRKLNHMTFACYRRCAQVIMDQWTNKMTGMDCFDTEIDKDFFQELREIKLVGEKEREHKHLVTNQLKSAMVQKCFTDLEANFRVYSRAILSIAGNLHRPRDIKNLFVEVSALSDHFRPIWNYQELEMFLNVYTQSGLDLDVVRDSSSAKAIWDKYMKVISECLLAMYV